VGDREEATYDTDQPVNSLNDSLKQARKMLRKAQRDRKRGTAASNHPEAKPGQRGRSPTPHPKKGKPSQSPPADRVPVRLAPTAVAGGAADHPRHHPNQQRNPPPESRKQPLQKSSKKWWSGAWSAPRGKSSKGKGKDKDKGSKKGSKKGRGKGGKSTGKTSGKGRR